MKFFLNLTLPARFGWIVPAGVILLLCALGVLLGYAVDNFVVGKPQ